MTKVVVLFQNYSQFLSITCDIKSFHCFWEFLLYSTINIFFFFFALLDSEVSLLQPADSFLNSVRQWQELGSQNSSCVLVISILHLWNGKSYILSTLPERKCILSNTFSKTFIHHNKLYHKNAAYTNTNIKYTEYFFNQHI